MLVADRPGELGARPEGGRRVVEGARLAPGEADHPVEAGPLGRVGELAGESLARRDLGGDGIGAHHLEQPGGVVARRPARARRAATRCTRAPYRSPEFPTLPGGIDHNGTMVIRQQQHRDAPRTVVDHPAVTGDLATILSGRNIAVGMTRDGQVLLARPDSAVVEVPRDAARRSALSELVKRPRLPRARRGPGGPGEVGYPGRDRGRSAGSRPSWSEGGCA